MRTVSRTELAKHSGVKVGQDVLHACAATEPPVNDHSMLRVAKSRGRVGRGCAGGDVGRDVPLHVR